MKKISAVLLFFFYTVFGLTQEREWFSLPEELSGGSVRKIIEFQGELVACGTFTTAGGQPVSGIASWNGTSWTGLDEGLTLNGGLAYPLDMVVFHDSLYVVGNFDTAGNVSSVHVAGWDGTDWFSMGSGTDFFISTIEAFNDTLYVGGNFDTINGIEAKGIAKWNGLTWQNVGNGTRNIVGAGDARNLYVHDNKLFISGNIDSAGNIACENIAWWDGSVWGTFPSPSFPSFGAPMITWLDTLLFCTGGSDVGTDNMNGMHFWDGTTYYWYTWQAMSDFLTMAIFEGELYGGGYDLGYDYGNTVWKRSGGTWIMAGTGLNDGIATMCEFNGDLYVGGSFSVSTGSEHNRIARYAELNSIPENQNQVFSVYPNPANSIITLSLNQSVSANVQIELTDAHGRILQFFENVNSNAENAAIILNVEHLEPGIYFIKVSNGSSVMVSKFIKE